MSKVIRPNIECWKRPQDDLYEVEGVILTEEEAVELALLLIEHEEKKKLNRRVGGWLFAIAALLGLWL